jgi:Outer membrane lipoprotein carrier protein LolA-like
MISGIVPLVLTLLAAQAPAAPADATALIEQLARRAPATTVYTEVRFVHLLREPLVLHGELEYGGDDRLGKRVDTPFRETTTIGGGVARVEREGRPPREIPLERAPALAALLGGFSALLGGDAAALGRRYMLDLKTSRDAWTLTLSPRDAELARHLRSIIVDGRAQEPGCFSVEEAGGDMSILLLDALARAPLAQPTRAQLVALCRRVGP